MPDQDSFSKINRHSVSAFKQYLSMSGVSPKSIKRKMSSLRKFTSWAEKEGLIKKGSPPRFHRTYRALPYLTYLNFLILIIFGIALGFGVYRQFIVKTKAPLAYPNEPISPKRYLSFQGRLTNANNTPIPNATNVTFKLYNTAGTGSPPTGGTLLWNSGACSIDPDQDGIFNTVLGSDCGTEIATSVFTENQQVWLEITVVAEVMDPRIQIATVAYALNSATLQGFPVGSLTSATPEATMGATARTIPAINPAGNLVIAAASPTLWSTSGTFSVKGQALSIVTDTGTNGNVTIAPDGSGVLNLTLSAGTGHVINATDANLGTSGGKEANTLYYGKVQSNSTNYNLLKLESGSSPTPKFTIDYAGNASMAGALNVLSTITANTTGTINGVNINSGTISNATWNGVAIGTTYGGTGQNFGSTAQGSVIYFSGSGAMAALGPTTSGYVLTTQGASNNPIWTDQTTVGTNYWNQTLGALYPKISSVDLLIGGSSTASAKFAFTNTLTGTPTATFSGNLVFAGGARTITATNMNSLTIGNSSTQNVIISPNGNVGVGTTAPTQKLDVSGNATISGTLALAPQTEAYAGTCNATIKGKMFFKGSDNKYYYCNGSSWTEMGGGAGVWTDEGTYIYPSTISGGYFRVYDDSSTTISSTVGTSGTAFDLVANSLTSGKVLSLSSTSITTGSMLYIANNTANNANLLHLEAGASLTDRLTLDSNGNLKVYDTTGSKSLNLSHNGTNGVITASSGNVEIGSGGGDFLIGESGTAVDIHFAESANIEADANKVITLTDIGNITPDVTNTYNLGSASLLWANLYAQNATVSGTLALGPQTQAYAGNCDVTNKGKMFYSAAENKYYYCNASSWTELGAGSGISWWTQSLGLLYPINNSLDIAFGGTSTTSAKFAFTNILTGTPTATFSGNLVLAGGARTISATNMNSLTIGNSSTQNVIINPNGNVGIGLTNPSSKLEVNGSIEGDRFVDTTNSSYFLDPAAAPSLSLAGYATAGASLALGATDAPAGPGNLKATGTVNAERFTDYTNSNYFLDPAAASSLNLAGYATAGASLAVGYSSVQAGIGNAAFAGSVGIGTTSPANKLQVNDGSASVSGISRLHNPTNANTGFGYQLLFSNETVGGVKKDLGGITATRNNNALDYSANLNLQASSDGTATTYMTILYNGNVGIGTTGPGARLDLGTGTGTKMLFYNDRPADAGGTKMGIYLDQFSLSNNATFVFASAAAAPGTFMIAKKDTAAGSTTLTAPYLTIAGETGNVGIGTSSPGAKLDVAGAGTIVTTGHNTEAAQLELGQTRTGSGYAYIDLHGDTTYSDYGMRIIRDNTGVNASSTITSRGTGGLYLTTSEAGSNIILSPGGNVGIGTTGPGYKLDVNPATNNTIVRVGPGAAIVEGVVSNQAMFGRNVTYTGSWTRVNADYATAIRMYNDPGDGSIAFHLAPSDTAGSAITNWDTSDVKMMIRNNGNVGIGATTPDRKLEIQGGHGSTILHMHALVDGGSQDANLFLWASEPGYTYNGTGIGNNWWIDGGGVWTRQYTSAGGSYVKLLAGSIGLGVVSSGGTDTSVMTIDSTGFDVTGTIYANSGGTAASAISGTSSNANWGGIQGTNSGGGFGVYGTGTTGTAVFGSNTSSGYGVYGQNTSTGYALYCLAITANKCGGNQAWYNASDRRLKENIKPIDNALYKVLNLQGIVFSLKSDPLKTPQLGFIAQDVLPYVPEVVGYDPTRDEYGMSGASLTALLVEAVKEQQTQIASLSGQLAEMNFNDAGDLEIVSDNSNFRLIKSPTNEIIERVGAFSQALIANLKAGFIETKELLAENITTQKLVSPIVYTDELKAGSVETEQLTTQQLTADSIQARESKFGKISTQNLEVSEDATIGGTLYAEKIQAREIIGLESKFGSLMASQVSTNVLGKLKEDLTQTFQDLFGQGSPVPEASQGATLADQASSWTLTDPSQDLEIKGNVRILGMTSTASLSVAGTFSQDGTFIIDNGDSINVVGGTLFIQNLGLGGVDILAGKVVVDVEGNVQITGNLAVEGEISSSRIALKESGFGEIFEIKNKNDETVASIDASGSAFFAQVGTKKVLIATAEATPSSEMTGSEIATNATAGKATLSAYETEITIKSPFVTDNTLIYVTPISSTQNKVLYVKAKQAVSEQESGWFKVGFDTATTQPVEFNWWIIN